MRLMLNRREASRRGTHLLLALLLLPALGGSHDLRSAVLVGWVVQQRTDIVDEQRI